MSEVALNLPDNLDQNPSKEAFVRKGVRWLARLLSILLLLMTGFFALYEGVPNPFVLTPRELACDGGFFAMIIGLLISWRFERTGALLAVAGFVSFTAANYLVSQSLTPGVTGLMPVAAVIIALVRPRR